MKPMTSFSDFDQDSIFKPRPSSLSKMTTHKRSQLTQNNQDLGIYSNIKIDSYESNNNQGKLIKLIDYDHLKKKFEFDNNGMLLLQKYSSYQVGFISIVGERQNGKSFILDKILNLAGVKGNHFSVNQQQGIWIWSVPFKKRNMKVFLLDCQGFTTQNIHNHEFKFIEIMLLLSNVTIFNHRSRTHANDLSCFQRILQNVVKDVKINGGDYYLKSETISRNLQHIYRSQKISKQSQQLSKYFPEYTFSYLQDAMTPGYQYKDSDLTQCSFLTTSCVNEKFIRHIAILFKSIMGSILQRSYNDIDFEGSIVIKLIQHILNKINKSLVVDVGQIFNDITKDLYKSAYNYCILTYSQLLQKQFKDQQPKSMQVILQIFGNLRDRIIETYNGFNLNKHEHQFYLQKLQQHISNKESMILTINKKKTQNTLWQGFTNVHVTTTTQAMDQLNKFHDYKKQLDHGRDEVMIEFCKKLLEAVVKNSDNIELQQKVQVMKDQITNKQNQLMGLKKKADQLEKIYNKQKQNSTNNKTRQEELDRKIQMQHQKQTALFKDNENAKSQMNKLTNEYQQRIKRNQAQIDDLNEKIILKTSKAPHQRDQNQRAKEEQQLKKKDTLLKTKIQQANKQIQRLKAQIQKKKPKKK